MNKKLIILPLMVFSFAATSCNSNNWNTIEETKVFEISKNIKDGAAKLLDEFENNDTLVSIYTQTYYYDSGKTHYNHVKKQTDFNDGKGLYGKYLVEENSESHSGTSHEVYADYTILSDKHAYILGTRSYSGMKSAAEVDEATFRKSLKENAKENYVKACAKYYELNAQLETYLPTLKEKQKYLENKKDGSYLNYHFESNGDNSLKFIVERKEMNIESGQKDLHIDYEQRNVEIVCVNNFIQSMHDKTDERGTLDGTSYTQIEDMDYQFTLNGSINHDSINLNDFYITTNK